MNHTLVITSEPLKERILQILRDLPLDPVHEVVIREHKNRRSLEQNARMWAMLTDISKQVDWYGQKLSKEEWKDVFTAAIKRQKVVPGLEGGFVVIGAHTSKMTVQEICDITELMFAFGAEKKVVWSDPTIPKEET